MQNNNLIYLRGNIVFEPEDKTNKHKLQSSWKKSAMVLFDGEDCEYYSWFINKRYGLKLNKPLRSAHLTFINDRFSDINNNEGTLEEKEIIWNSVKEKYNDTEVEVILDVDVRTNSEHYWMNIPHEHREELQKIRSELGLGRPYFGMHFSVGYCNEKNKEHSEYVHRLMVRENV